MVTERLKLFKARNNQYEICDAFNVLRLLALVQGDLAQAHTYLQETLTIAAAVNNRETLGYAQPLLALVTLYGGDAREARHLLSESLHLCLELKDKFYLARVCAILAEVELKGSWQRPNSGWRAVLLITPIRTDSPSTRYNGSLLPMAGPMRELAGNNT